MPLVQDIAAAEEATFNYHRARGEMTDGNYNGLQIVKFSPKDRSGYYYKSKIDKKKIVLHYTIGYIGGDLSNLTRNNRHVSVPFVIARNGVIVQLFDPEYWSYHLTPGAVGGNKRNSSQSVPIELTGLGPLDLSGNWMFNYYGSKYCRATETEHFFDHGGDYRGYRYFTRFTDAQYSSLSSLLSILAHEFNIPETFLAQSERFDLFSSPQVAQNYSGICSHVNFQPPSVKNDIGPAFEWSHIGG